MPTDSNSMESASRSLLAENSKITPILQDMGVMRKK